MAEEKDLRNQKEAKGEEEITSPLVEKEEENATCKENSKIKKLEEEISSLKDLYLRKQAEFENFRKRTEKDKEELILYTKKQLMEEFIQLMDNFDRALIASEEIKNFDQFYEGISLIRKSFLLSMQRKYQLESFGNAGEIFDPEKHKALTVENDPSIETPLIKEVFQKGYSLQGRIIRTADVKVIQV